MTTGHLSYSTIHASDMHALIQRLESPPIELPRALLTSLDMIVFLNSVTVRIAPVRRITNVTEIIKLDPETNRLVTMTPFHWVSEIDDRFESTGGSQILHIKLQYGWEDDTLIQELQNRKLILEWMIRKQLRSYEDVGRIVADYSKDPDGVLPRIKEDRAMKSTNYSHCCLKLFGRYFQKYKKDQLEEKNLLLVKANIPMSYEEYDSMIYRP